MVSSDDRYRDIDWIMELQLQKLVRYICYMNQSELFIGYGKHKILVPYMHFAWREKKRLKHKNTEIMHPFGNAYYRKCG